jgi:hypothetical protein
MLSIFAFLGGLFLIAVVGLYWKSVLKWGAMLIGASILLLMVLLAH